MSVTVDQILQRMIVDAKNYNPTIKISQGTENYIRFAAAASAIWGLYKQMDWTLDQIFPTTMNQESLEQWANDRGLDYSNLTASELLTLILSYLRNPKSGGKPSDYERWALEASSTGKAIGLESSMITGNMPNLSAANAVKPHDREGVAFACGTDDTGKYMVIDLASSKQIVGVGLGFITNRPASFSVFTSDDGQSWTRKGKVDTAYWWAMVEFSEVSARYVKFELEEIEAIESWQLEELNEVKCFGVEIYSPATMNEAPSRARCLDNHYGIGTVLMLVGPRSLSMRCCEAIRAKCEYEGPVAPREIWANVPTEPVLSLRVTVQGLQNMNEETFREDVAKYFAALEPGDLFIPAQIVVYVLKNGGTNATIDVSQNGGDYQEQTDAIPSGKTEQFTLGDLVVQ
ncbi:MAG: hypothetical protein II892_12345 [Fibrobacter sp.]|nr:hypothetical protein [Fibrobacter sp.]MBQ3778154.1 hypothetical protein [Fibrobacter sp.]